MQDSTPPPVSQVVISGEERCGPPLLPSPDGRYVACHRVITDFFNETGKGYGAGIRIG